MMSLDWMVYALGAVAVVFLLPCSSSIKSTIDMLINLKTHIQTQSKIMKKRQKKRIIKMSLFH